MTDPSQFRNEAEKKAAVKRAIDDTERQIKMSEEYLIRRKQFLKDLLSGKIDNPSDY